MSKSKVVVGKTKPRPLKFFGGGDPAANWSTFKKEWTDYEEASGLTNNSSTERVVTFLRVVGKDAINIYNTFSWPEETDSRNIDKVIEKFEALCLSGESSRFQRYLFHTREQEAGEKIDDYVEGVKALAQVCGFGDVKEMLICDKVIFGLRERVIKEEMLKSEEMDIIKLVKLIKEKEVELSKKHVERLKAFEKLKLKNKKGKTMADDIEMMGLADEIDYEESDGAANAEQVDGGEGKVGEDELIIKADSDIESVHEDEISNGQEGIKKDDESAEVTQTKRDSEFTSEDFKIEVRGLPRYFAMGQLKKLFNEVLQLKAHKIKPAGNNKDWAYVTFRDERSRVKALAVLDEYKWKNCTLTASIAKAVEDPVLKRNQLSKLLEGDDPDSKMPINDRVVKSVTPLADIDYEQQLKDKQKAALGAMRKFGNEMAKTNPELKQWVKFHKLRRKGQICEMLDIVPSPVTENYRNKCEFTVGINPDDELPTVGFRVSSYKSGTLAVGPVEHLRHIPDNMKNVVKVFQEYVRNSKHAPFCPLTHEGVWRQLTVRTSLHDDILIAVVVHPQEFSEEELGDIKEDIVDYFRDGSGSSAGVTSIYFQAVGQKAPGPEDETYDHLWGEEYITETVLGKKFRISCESFFQVNTKACEALYDTVATLAELDGTSVILDICCGTGTIGVSLADQCLKVYGIEMVKKAADDARHNAQVNGVENIAVYTGKAEVNMNAVLAQCVKYSTVGIVDPPRAGLSESVVRSLRKCDNMDRLIYMSCDPEGAFKNFIDLSRPKSKNYKGEFFVPVKAAIVDLFPHTPHYELLILFERWEERKWRRIMEGNPLPRDQRYFDRLPAKPEGAVEQDSDDEESSVQNTGMGSWKSISGKRRNRETYQPYNNPRQQYAEDDGYYGRGYPGRGLLGELPSGLMGDNPYEDRFFGGGGSGSSGPSSSYDRYYDDSPGRRFDRYSDRPGFDRYSDRPSIDRFPDRPSFDRLYERREGGNRDDYYNRPSGDPYRLSREEYDQPINRRLGSSYGGLPDRLDAFRRNDRGFMRF